MRTLIDATFSILNVCIYVGLFEDKIDF